MSGAGAASDRDAALGRGDAVWEQLRRRLDAAGDAAIGGDGWTGKDVYAHLARWQQRSVAAWRAVLHGELPSSLEDEDALNDRWHEQDQALNIDEARAQCLRSRGELRGLAASLNAAQWNRYRAMFDDVTGEHYEHHLRAATHPQGA